MVGRVSSHGLTEAMLQASLSVQAKFAAATTQQASGLVTGTYGGLGSDAAPLISLENSQARLTAWSDTTQTANARVQTMYAAVGGMIDQLTSLRSTLSAAMSDVTNAGDVNQTGAAMLDDLAALMNTQLDGRYLFAGSNTDIAPVDVSALATPALPSSPDTGYYTGNGETQAVRVSESQTIAYGVTADGSGFESALRAANIVATLATDPMDTAALTEAYDLATAAMDALLATQAGLSVTSGRLESALTRQDSALGLLDSMAADIKSVDAAEISVRLTEYEAQLTASYSALAKLNKVNLVDYL